MSAVAKMLWSIESRLREPLMLDDLVAATGRSKSHLSRVFPMITGYSISTYLRARRLTEAAKQLASGAPDILSVALEAGYGSHEAFTRAFRDQFGVTPEAVRRQRSLENLELLEPLRMNTIVSGAIAAPRFENHPRMHFAGISRRHLMNPAAGLATQWQDFLPYIGNVDGSVPGAAYGIVGDMHEKSEEFEYITAVEIRENVDVQPELKRITVPALTFARFMHPGDITSIRSTIGSASDWLVREGHEASEAPFAFLEYYGPAFRSRDRKRRYRDLVRPQVLTRLAKPHGAV